MKGVELAHIVGWGVTGLLFVGNLLWNYLNRLHTNNLAKKIRDDSYKKEVWDRHRARIETNLADFVSFVSTLPAQVSAVIGNDGAIPKLDIFQLNLVVAHDDLARSLADADASEYCHGNLWAATAYGSSTGSETSWDLLLEKFSIAMARRSSKNLIDDLKGLRRWALEIELAVRNAIRLAELQYKPKQ